MNICPLCNKNEDQVFFANKQKTYFQCKECHLVFAAESCLLNSDQEQDVYRLHQNNSNDERYKEFMERILSPLRRYIREGESGIDYGCGPGPVISSILGPEGYEIVEYDPFFKNDEALLEQCYDFLIATEVIEHIYQTREGLESMLNLVKEGGVIALMTSFYPSDIDKFKLWGYHQDPTHVRFFNESTCEWIARKYSLDFEIPRENVVIFKKGLGHD
ncbi:putative methyltransferase [Halobacteriovorax marinus SJ]|uniref:Methyltransferase n=1 Tax=Halobacteriovorax marinus (strain ATCC BAA-682 / DSM 15412 / SJ) TaxID=862908 RepID=E1X582_HALMS|nr:class I SAM-dependent methyltransferase [Halobacteriovorax marinus]CBW25554.1 putative methyltransferase [Halobacteriovorax marinus SJ]